MEPFRSRFNGALSVIGAVILMIGNTRRAASEFPTMTCTSGTDGASADSPCMHKAYLGSTVKIDCKSGYDTNAPTAIFTTAGPTMCSEKMPAAPTACPKEVTFADQGLSSVKVEQKTYYVPWMRDIAFKGPVKLYGRCSKSDSEALYFGIEFIPRPKFPSTGIFVSCPSLVTTANSTCMLETRLGDFAVFDCPAGTPPTIEPAQTSDKATVCSKDMSSKFDQTCTGATGSPTDLSGDGVTAVMLKNGANQLRTLGYKNPETGTKPAPLEGYVNCRGASSVTAYYKYKMEFQASKYKMPAEFTVCDPVNGSDRSKPCVVTLAPGKSYVVNCSSLKNTSPENLMKSDGYYCTEVPGAGTSDLCADKKKKWSEYGVQVFSNAGHLVITHTRDNLSSQVKASGKCFEGADANYFEITLDTTTTTSKAPVNQAFTASRSNGLGIFLGILGFICISTEAFLKI